jgi:hypothetical protein
LVGGFFGPYLSFLYQEQKQNQYKNFFEHNISKRGKNPLIRPYR